MKRADFLKKSLIGAGTLASGAAVAAVVTNNIDELKPLRNREETLGFNHIPNTKSFMTNSTVLHKADTRGSANHGWLNAKHTFSFANYYNPERMNFGVLRVLNDDSVAGGMGFGTHPHDNMEIITIPLEGGVLHKDSMGNSGVISNTEVQVMSAGSGIQHSEFNSNAEVELKLLQIWLFPNKGNVTPRYDQIKRDTTTRNEFVQILSPSADDAGVWIYQDAWFNTAILDSTKELTYAVHNPKTNGVYAFVIGGDVTINGQSLNKRDGFGVWNVTELKIMADSNAEILLMEVPMEV